MAVGYHDTPALEITERIAVPKVVENHICLSMQLVAHPASSQSFHAMIAIGKMLKKNTLRNTTVLIKPSGTGRPKGRASIKYHRERKQIVVTM
jgi:hypothetical protein